MATSFECVECKHVFDKPHDPFLTVGSFILFVIAIVSLFGFFPLSIGLFILIWWMNQNKCPKCKSKRIITTTKLEPDAHAKPSSDTSVSKKKHMSGVWVFIIFIVIFTGGSLGLLAILSATIPGEPEMTQEQQDAVLAAQEGINSFLDSFVISSEIYNDSGTLNLKITFTNNNELEKTVDGIEVRMFFSDNFDEPVGKWGSSERTSLTAQSQQTLPVGATKAAYWDIDEYEGATKITDLQVIRVHFTDGNQITRL